MVTSSILIPHKLINVFNITFSSSLNIHHSYHPNCINLINLYLLRGIDIYSPLSSYYFPSNPFTAYPVMGCGLSTLDPEDAGFNRFENGDEGESLHGNSNNNSKNKKKNKDASMAMKPLGDKEAKDKEGSNGERLKEKSGVGKNDIKMEVRSKKKDDEHEYRDDDFIGPGSPSFREYCNDYDSGDRSFMEYSNDSDSSGNGSEASLNRNNKPMNEESVDSNKEPLKKERRGRGFRNAIGKRKARGRRNLLNFACYSRSSESHVEGSSDKNVVKTA